MPYKQLDKRVRHNENEKIRAVIVNGIADWACGKHANGNYNNGAIYIMAALTRAGYKVVKNAV